MKKAQTSEIKVNFRDRLMTLEEQSIMNRKSFSFRWYYNYPARLVEPLFAGPGVKVGE